MKPGLLANQVSLKMIFRLYHLFRVIAVNSMLQEREKRLLSVSVSLVNPIKTSVAMTEPLFVLVEAFFDLVDPFVLVVVWFSDELERRIHERQYCRALNNHQKSL